MDMGNFWSSSVEVQVGLSEWPQGKREVLLKVFKYEWDGYLSLHIIGGVDSIPYNSQKKIRV